MAVTRVENTVIKNVQFRGSISPPSLPAAAVGGTFPLLYRFDFAAGANAAQNIVVDRKIRVIDAFLILRGAGVASETLTIGNAGNAISSAMAASGSDQALVRATTINDANWEIAAGGQLRATPAAGATQPDMTVYVIAHPVD